jgi:hypothetical protein
VWLASVIPQSSLLSGYLGAQGYVATTNIGGDNSNTSADVIHISD